MTLTTLSMDELDTLIRNTVAGDRNSRERLFDYIQQFVSGLSLRQLGPYSRDPDCRAEVCTHVVVRFLHGDHASLRRYLTRPGRCFAALLRVAAARAAIEVARGMSQNIAARRDPGFRWVREVEFLEADHAGRSGSSVYLSLFDIRRYLETRADPTDVELLRQSIQSRSSWREIARGHNLSADAARQRVHRLRRSLQAWMLCHRAAPDAVC